MSRVVVVGSINMDLVATAPRHPRVGETVLGGTLERFPGGKGANQAVAAARAGADTTMIGAVGDDDFGAELTAFLEAEGVDIHRVGVHRSEPTGTALIVVADSDNTIVVIPGANSTLSPGTLDAANAYSDGDVVVAQLETPQEATAAAFDQARSVGAITVLNAAPAAPLLDGMLDRIDYLIVNETELELLSAELSSPSSPAVICTLGERGARSIVEGRETTVEGLPVAAVDTTGAGDCFVGYFAAGLAGGAGPTDAVERANRAAAISVQRHGAAPSIPTADEVDQSP